ncbi:hypothetical protein [Winogradskya humida]|uniref:hypothetical protein n=1 Tax=Winogradskya humida TaxID=113566 RepID=UPI0019437D93|nr:hypothetical protein [Actinoplanes humidus]
MSMKKLAVVLAAGVTLAGCAEAGTTPAGEKGTDGKAALSQSLDGLQAGNYTFSRTDGGSVEGAVDVPGSSVIRQEGRPSILRVGDTVYLRYRIYGEAQEEYAKLFEQYAGKADKKQAAELAKAKEILTILDGEHWVKADYRRLVAAADAEDLSGMENLPPTPTAAKPDVTGASDLVAAVVTATRKGDEITGTLDATKVDPKLNLLTNDPYYVYGPRAGAMPFTATLDAQGRLTKLTLDLPGQLKDAASQAPETFPSDAPTEPADKPIVITISQYGGTAAQTAPQGATDLDPAAYEQLTNDTD